jgi:hypothetical protein
MARNLICYKKWLPRDQYEEMRWNSAEQSFEKYQVYFSIFRAAYIFLWHIFF